MSDPASERTEEPTDRRKKKERDKGNVPKSQDLTSALMITIGVAALSIFSKKILSTLHVMFYNSFTQLDPKSINISDISQVLAPYFLAASQIILPIFLLLFFAGIIVARAQVGTIFAISKVKFDLENIAPSKIFKAAKKMINPADPKTLVEFFKSLIKLLIVGGCGYTVINGRKDELYALLGLNISSSFAVIGSILTQMLVNMCLAMLVIGILDKKYQDYEYNKSIKMTKQDVKDEYKDSEGDPKIKAKIRSIQIRMATQKMMSAVPKADVVVTNPTHYAIALQYDRLKSPAPRVIAKGVDFVAFKIREVAQNNKVPIVENPPLARALYKLVPIDGIIPSDMFVAVAEVLAYVYNKDKQGG